MSDDKQDAKASSERDASVIRDIDASDESQVNIQSETKRHSHPKPHNESGTGQFNGLAMLFGLLSNVVPPKYFDYLFGVSGIGGILAFAYWYMVEISFNFPVESVSVPKYAIAGGGAAIIGLVYLVHRTESQCDQCGTPFSLRRRERELERDKYQGKPDELLVRREEWCTTCGWESEKKEWRKDGSQEGSNPSL